MYQNYQQNNSQNQQGSSNVNSQYRGYDTKYQPIGYVQSQYNQSLNPSYSNQFQNSSNQYSNFQNNQNQNQSQQSFHTSNYRGDQQGHDAYLRSDSTQPAQSQYINSYSNQSPSYSSMGNSYSTQQYSQQQNPESFHTASYRGNQQGHDAYLRSDSTQTAQSQYGIGAAGNNSYNMGMNNSYGSSQSYGQQQQQQQFQSPQSFHTSNYRGDQQGHDAYLRSDSSQPAQNQFGSQQNSGYNRYQF